MIRPITTASQGFLDRGASATLALASLGLLRDDDGPTPPPSSTTVGGSPSGRSEGFVVSRARRLGLLLAIARAGRR